MQGAAAARASRDKTQSPPGIAVQPPHTRWGRQAEARVDERAQSPRANEKAPVAAELPKDAARDLDPHRARGRNTGGGHGMVKVAA